MLQKLYEKGKELQPRAETILFPLILALYPFVGVARGVDVTDSLYALTYYEYGQSLDRMWYFATFLPNLTGALLMYLPGGQTLLGMQIYCTLFISATALITYYLLRRFALAPWMNFLGLFIAENLCWCPRVILYNYMTYFFYTVGTLLLVRALSLPVAKRRTLFFSGALLGLNVLTRVPNVLEVSMVVVIFCYGVWSHKKKLTMCRELFFWLAGYIIGFFIPFAAISLRYDREAYVRMLSDLFGMTTQSTSHSTVGTLSLIGSAYAHTFSHMAIMAPCIAAGVVMFRIFKERYVKEKKILFVIGIVILVAFYFRRGVFTFHYRYYDSMFQIAMMFVILSVALFVLDIAGVLHGHGHERMLSTAALITILVTPIGSNNYTYPVLNNLFFVAPVALSTLRRAVRRAMQTNAREAHFTWSALSFMIVAVLIVQGTLFHFSFSFRDGMNGEARRTVITEVPRLKHMITTEENAERLTDLYLFLRENGLIGREAILFGDIPGLSFVCELRPALFTTWPDLPSNTTERFNAALDELEILPLIIVHEEENAEVTAERKSTYLQMFRMQSGYDKIYEDDFVTVYEAEGAG